MATGIFTLAFALLIPGVIPVDTYPINQRSILIPIKMDPARRAEIKEMILFSSSDQGKSWHQEASITPEKESFQFYAPGDGVFWFTMVVADKKNKRFPEDVYKSPPDQKILIDTQKPVLRIVSADRHGDEIAVSWEIQEEYPDLATLKLEYRTPDAAANQWYTAIVNQSTRDQVRFTLHNPGQLSIRMQVKDLAGNLATATAEIPSAPPPTPDAQVASSTNPSAAYPMNSSPIGGGVANGNTGASSWQTENRGYASYPPSNPSPSLPGSAWENTRVPAQTVSTFHSEAPALNEMRNTTTSSSNYAENSGLNGGQGRLSSNRYVPSHENGFGSNSPAFGNNSALPRGPLPPIQIVNSTQVTINYQVNKVGPSGLGKVELYYTKDEGQSWTYYGEDGDLQSPMIADLPGEGMYGFWLVLESKAGKGKRKPITGDRPEMRVEVDLTPPVARLFSPESDAGRSDAVVLTWKAMDRNLSTNPIALEWAERPDGPWKTIAKNLVNSGRYVWQLTPDLPISVHLRLKVTDKAGNFTVNQLSDPVVVDLSEPEGHLVGVVGNPER